MMTKHFQSLFSSLYFDMEIKEHGFTNKLFSLTDKDFKDFVQSVDELDFEESLEKLAKEHGFSNPCSDEAYCFFEEKANDDIYSKWYELMHKCYIKDKMHDKLEELEKRLYKALEIALEIEELQKEITDENDEQENRQF